MSTESDNPIVSAFNNYSESFAAFNEAWGAFQLAMRCGRSATPEAQTEAGEGKGADLHDACLCETCA